MSIGHTFLTTVLLALLIHGVPALSLIKSSVPPQLLRNDSSNDFRLPTDIEPLSYNITLIPDMEGENFTFDGESQIKIRFRKTTQNIALHFKDLILKPGVTIQCVPRYNERDVKSRVAEDILIISLAEEISTMSTCTLKLRYSGKDNGGNRGFYRTSYTNKDGKKQFMASTQFEPISARQVFPCWDEPAIKASFNISIKHSRKYKALSNMPSSTSPEPGNVSRIITHFGPSPIMSTYLVAFAVGDFAPVDEDKYDFQVWSRKDVADNGKYALKVGPTILEALENYTNYPYAEHKFFKMDSLAVPELSASAMENWGLVIYKENDLLYEEDSHSTFQKESIVTIMAHELAHQWFGNLVTAEWWDDIWLNEGFANYFQYVITNQIEPSWRFMDRFVVNNLQGTAFVADSRADSHAMVEKRKNNTEIMESFDSITYSKSGSVIRMISYVLGEEEFKTGLRGYIKAKASKSATSDDLFTELVKVDKKYKNLKDVLKNWVNTPGFPVINVRRNYIQENATITQSRFFDTINTTSAEKYWIPINYVTEDDLNFEKVEVAGWLDPLKDSLSIDLPKKGDQFVIFNKQQFGYYRVNYDDDNWKMISRYLAGDSTNHTNINVLNRAQLIDDALNLAKVNKLQYTIALPLVQYLNKEKDFIPWSAAWRGFEYIAKTVANTEFAPRFKEFVLQLSEHLVQEVLSIELNGTDHTMQLKKVETLKSACTYGSNLCRSQATEILTKWLDNPKDNALSEDDRRWVICGGVRNAAQATWDKLWNKYLTESSGNILTALGCTSDTKILQGYIKKVISANQTENLSAVFKAIYTGSDEGVDVVLNYLISNYKELKTYTGYSKDQLKSDFTSLAEWLTNEEQKQKLVKFKNDADDKSKDVVDGALISVENNLKKFGTHLDQFNALFKKEVSTTPAPLKPDSANVFTLSTIVILASLLITRIY